jgi:hypothetical protein
MYQLLFLKNEWLDSLRALQAKWSGKLDDGLGNASDNLPHYAALTIQIGSRKVYLARENTGALDPCFKIYSWGDWDIELLLRKEGLHDRFLKSVGLDYELTLEGSEIDIIGFNKKFLIKGAPPEPIKSFFSESRTQDLVAGLADFDALYIKDGSFKIVYNLDSPDQIRADTLNDLVSAVIKFIEAIEADKSLPKIIRQKFVPLPKKKPLAFDFNTRKTVGLVLLVELFLLAVFGNTIIKYFIRYSDSHNVSDRNGAILVLIMFGIPLVLAFIFTIKRLLALSTIDSCGVTLDSTDIKPGDTVGFAVGLTALTTIKTKEIILTVSNNSAVEKAQGTGYQVAEGVRAYSKDYVLARDLVLEKGRPYVFKGRMDIPAEAVPSGVTKDAKRSVINALDMPEYYVESSTWTYRVKARIDYFPDYSFEKEFEVRPKAG